MNFRLPLSAFLAGATLASAQTAPQPAPSANEPVNLEQFVVTASPFQRAQDEIAQPTSVLAGQRLTFARQATLGETLANEPGIASTYFGPGASRPVIRGLGGDRIRVLQGGIGTLDASVLSPDHAVSLDPLLIDRIEIVRGPATLLYGGSAIGGAVNVIDGRIPEEKPAAPLGGRIETRLGSAAAERAAAGVITGAAGPFAWRIDGFTRRTDDVKLPSSLEGDLANSATDTAGAGAGVTYVGERGHVGLAYSGFATTYGVPDGETPPIHIDLRQRRWDLHGELFRPAAGFRVARVQFGRADYRHTEFEGDEPGTRFDSQALEGRVELLHEKIGPFEGALGTQFTRQDLRVTGDEAFLPPAITQSRALFLFEEAAQGAVTWQLGARVEAQDIKPDRSSGLAPVSHTNHGVSGGFVWKLADSWSLAATLSRSARAPSAQELYADGPHAGTGTYELGDSSLGSEKATGFDLSLRRRAGFLTGVATVFVTDFRGFLFEAATGAIEDGLPVYQFEQRDARFTGGELEVIAHLHESAGHQLDLRATADTVRATNRSDDEPLPRITPMRAGVGLDYRAGPLSLSADVRHGFKQDRLAPNETATDGYTTVSLAGAWRFKVGANDAEFFVRASNLTDEVVRVHTSFLKEVAPLPGRDFTAGLRFAF